MAFTDSDFNNSLVLFLALSFFFLMSKLKFLTGKTGKEMFVVDFPNTNLAFIIWL